MIYTMFIVKCLFAGAIVAAATWVKPRAQVRRVSKSVEKRSRKVISSFETEALDEDPEDTGCPQEPGDVRVRITVGGALPKPSPRFERSKIVRLAAAHVRAKVGLLKRTEANMMVARKLVNEFLEDRKDLRKTHWLAIVPLAVELAFVPTIYDIEARDMAGTLEWSGRREAYAADRVVAQGWGPWGLFGRREVRTAPPSG